MPSTLKRLGEAIPVYFAYGLFRILPVGVASALGGRLLRLIGPRLPSQAVAECNLAMALPEQVAEHPRIIRRMWDNLGRVMAEYAHLQVLGEPSQVEIVGKEHVQTAIASGKTAIFFSGHLANWEVPARAVKACGLELALVYRQPNNRFVDRLLRHARLPVTRTLAAKGGEGAKALIGLIRQNRSIGMLVDQKMNDGLPIPFFGRDAMTAPAMVKLAQKFDLPLYPVQIERTGGAHFKVTIHPALVLPNDLTQALTGINALLESWVRLHPEQWLWVHRRWPSDISCQISEVRNTDRHLSDL